MLEERNQDHDNADELVDVVEVQRFLRENRERRESASVAATDAEPALQRTLAANRERRLRRAQQGSTDDYTIFVGNPGAGKSTLLNGLAGTPVFRSGLSFGKGLTQRLQLVQVANGEFFGDTPGLDDIESRKEAAKEIESALKRDGFFRLVFVVTLEAGRVRPSDALTISEVLKAVENVPVPFAVILNKLPASIISGLEDPDNLTRVTEALLSQTERSTRFFLPLPLDSKLLGADNALSSHALVENVRDFLNRVPFVHLAPSQVKQVNCATQAEAELALRERIRRIQEDKEFRAQCLERRQIFLKSKRTKALQAAQAEHEKKIEWLERKRKKACEDFERRIDAVKSDRAQVQALVAQKAAAIQQLEQQISALK